MDRPQEHFALILSPTRELAIQIAEQVRTPGTRGLRGRLGMQRSCAWHGRMEDAGGGVCVCRYAGVELRAQRAGACGFVIRCTSRGAGRANAEGARRTDGTQQPGMRGGSCCPPQLLGAGTVSAHAVLEWE